MGKKGNGAPKPEDANMRSQTAFFNNKINKEINELKETIQQSKIFIKEEALSTDNKEDGNEPQISSDTPNITQPNKSSEEIQQLKDDLKEIEDRIINIKRLTESIEENCTKVPLGLIEAILKPSSKVYNIMDPKIKVLVKAASELFTKKDLGSIFRISTKSIRRWQKQGEKALRVRGRKRLDPAMEEKLVQWIKEQGPEFRFTPKSLLAKAKEFASTPKFKASKGYFINFKKRYKLEKYPDKTYSFIGANSS